MPPLFLISAALGGAAMYFFDPERGRRRRGLVRDKAYSARTTVRTVYDQGTRGLVHQRDALKGRWQATFGGEAPSDEVLVERVRSRMGHHCTHPGAIEVSAEGGQVTLKGSVLEHEHHPLVRAVSHVSGVKDIMDQLKAYDDPAQVPELQGSGRQTSPDHIRALQQNWSPSKRLVLGGVGTLLTLRGLLKHNRFAAFISFATGAALLARAFTNQPLNSLTGWDALGRAHDSNRENHHDEVKGSDGSQSASDVTSPPAQSQGQGQGQSQSQNQSTFVTS